MPSIHQVKTSSYAKNSIPRSAETLTHFCGIDGKPQHLPRYSTFDHFDLRVDYNEAGPFHRIPEKKGAGLIGNLMPDSFHRVRLMQVDFRPASQIHDEAQVLIENIQ
jgi:hypothetical protein